MRIYVISSIDGCNLVYVKTREEAVRICGELPGVFKWESLEIYRAKEPLNIK
jgi:hypothetical protein